MPLEAKKSLRVYTELLGKIFQEMVGHFHKLQDASLPLELVALMQECRALK